MEKRFNINVDSMHLNFLEVAVDTLLDELSDVINGEPILDPHIQDVVSRIEYGEKLRATFKKLRSNG